MEEVRKPRRPAAADVRQAPGRDADAQRGAEGAGAEVGDPVGAQLGVGVGGAEGPVAALEVLDDPRGDQDVDGGDERQPQRGRQDGADVGRLPGEPGQRGQDSGTAPRARSRQPRARAASDGQGDAQRGPPAIAASAGPAAPRPRPRSSPGRAAAIGPSPRCASTCDELPERAGGARRPRGQAQQRAELEDHHHRADAAREARDDRVRHLRRRTGPAGARRRSSGRPRPPGRPWPRPPTPWGRTAPAMNGTVALAVPPIRTGLRPSSAVTGAVRIDVNRPSSGGRPMSWARASP